MSSDTAVAEQVLSLLHDAARLLERGASRANPRLETVLCMVEAAAAGARAVEALEDVPEQRDRLLQELLATSRAAVTCASFAIAESRGAAVPALPAAE